MWQTQATGSSNGSAAFLGSRNDNNPRCKFCWAGDKSLLFTSYREDV